MQLTFGFLSRDSEILNKFKKLVEIWLEIHSDIFYTHIKGHGVVILNNLLPLFLHSLDGFPLRP